MIASPNNSENHRELVASTSSFVVFGSVLFFLERLGTPEIILAWALAAAILAIALLFAYSGRTTSAPAFFSANRSLNLTELLIGSSADILTTPLFLLIIFLQSGNSTAVLVLISTIIAGHTLNSWLFAVPFRKSGAYTMPDFLGYRFDSKLIRLLTLVIVLTVCAVFLFAELRLAGLYLAPIFSFSFEHVTAIIVILAGLASLLGGISSVSKLQSALILLVVVTVFSAAIWLALNLTGIPLPQSLLNYAGPLSQNQPLIDVRLAKELEFVFGLIESSGLWLVATLLLGFSVLPQLSNRGFLTQSASVIRGASIRSPVLIAILLTAIPALYYINSIAVGGSDAAATLVISAMPIVLQIFIPLTVLMIAISSTSLLLTIMANALSHDGYQVLRSGKVPPTRQIFMARIATILIAYFVWNYSVQPNFGALAMLIWALSSSISCILPVLLTAVFWTGISRAAALLGMGTGVLLTTFSFLVIETEFGRELSQAWLSTELPASGYSAALIGPSIMLVSLAVIYLASIIKGPDEAVAAKLKKLRDPAKETLITANL